MFSYKKKIYDIHLNVCVSQEETEISHREAEETFSRCQPLSHFLVTFPPTVPISISYEEAAKCCTKCFILPHLCLHPSISGVLIWTHCSCLCRSLALLQAKLHAVLLELRSWGWLFMGWLEEGQSNCFAHFLPHLSFFLQPLSSGEGSWKSPISFKPLSGQFSGKTRNSISKPQIDSQKCVELLSGGKGFLLLLFTVS